ncbi:MAG: hypothetical protein ACOZAQ_01270 [Pseudomonadota bacterium]
MMKRRRPPQRGKRFQQSTQRGQALGMGGGVLEHIDGGMAVWTNVLNHVKQAPRINECTGHIEFRQGCCNACHEFGQTT